jgi:hypothetical protein
MAATHPSEADIVGRTVRQAERLESIESVEQMNILEVNYTVNEIAGVTGVELVLTVGGPDIRVDALAGTVRGSWGGDTHTTHFDSDVVEQYGRQRARLFEQEHDL